MADLIKGIYRRIYAGFIWGKRINAVTLEAEAWFWRMMVVADDYGNLPADEARLCALTKGRRTSMQDSEIKDLCGSLESAGLVVPYSADGEAFYHIVGFTGLQPAGKNGRLVHRYPAHPPGIDAESGGIQNNPAQSGGVRGNPGNPAPPSSSPSPLPDHHHHHHQPKPDDGDDDFRQRVEYLTRKPEWLNGKPWIDAREAKKLAALPLTQEQVDDVIKSAKKMRATLDNPAGLVVKMLKEIAAEAA